MKHFYDTWLYHQMQSFIKNNDLEEGDWEDLDENDDYWKFLLKRIAEDGRTVEVRSYYGQENPVGKKWTAYLINESTEWDGCFLEFFHSKEETEKYCKLLFS